jgi:hypothetical protein
MLFLSGRRRRAMTLGGTAARDSSAEQARLRQAKRDCSDLDLSALVIVLGGRLGRWQQRNCFAAVR